MLPLQQIRVQRYYFIILILKLLQDKVGAHRLSGAWRPCDHDDLAHLTLLVAGERFHSLLDLENLFFPKFEFSGKKLPAKYLIRLKKPHLGCLQFDLDFLERVLVIFDELAVGPFFAGFGGSFAHGCL